MWHARFSRKELYELFLGGSRGVTNELKETNTVFTDERDDAYHAYWASKPRPGQGLPSLVVMPDEELSLFTAINSSPQAPTPVSSLCRFLSRREAHDQFGTATFSLGFDTEQDALFVMASLAMAEATIHSEGRIGLRQITPALCKRTFSYAWGRALSLGAPPQSLELLPSRWLETYGVINPHSSPGVMQSSINAVLGVLTVATQLNVGLRPKTLSGEMAFALFKGDSSAKEAIWREMSSHLTKPIDLGSLAAASREERGTYLQQALRAAMSPRRDGSPEATVAAACAFVATQVAPGSLEHLELLREASSPSVLMWYALYATLQAPGAVLSAYGGFGQRVLRDIAALEEPLARPTADISYGELRALERLGPEGFARKLGHVGEVQVELIPMITSSFTYSSRKSDGRSESVNQQLPLEQNPDSRAAVSTKAKLSQIMASLVHVIAEMPDNIDDNNSGSKKGRRR